MQQSRHPWDSDGAEREGGGGVSMHKTVEERVNARAHSW